MLPEDRRRRVWRNATTPGWFETMGMSMLSGRDFTDRDRVGSPLVAIVNEAFTRRYLPGRPPIGQTLRVDEDGPRYEIVGLVADAVYTAPRDGMLPTMYVPLAQRDQREWNSWRDAVLTIKAASGQRALVERDIAAALFGGGLSTTAEATTVSGRGVGLDAVRAAVEAIRGSVSLTWIPDRGTTFTLVCPPTLATLHVVLVRVGGQCLAVPTMHVERLLRVRPDDIRHADGRQVITTNRTPIPVVALARLLPPLTSPPAAGVVTVVVLRAGEEQLAVAVDTLVTEQEIVLRPLATGQPLPCVSGAAILGSGEVALVVNPGGLIAAARAIGTEAALRVVDRAPAEQARPRVLVVDDSITTRTLEHSILVAAGYDVRTAVDGADAWKALQEHGCDIVVADVEMPRMDGFTLCEAIRTSKRLKALPVVLVTALETPQHRERGLAVGADAYIGKSAFDQQHLLDTIRQLVG